MERCGGSAIAGRKPGRAARAAAILAFTSVALAAQAPAAGHPHIFFDLDAAICFAAGDRMVVRWTLFPNDMTCAAMFMEADLDSDNVIDDLELGQLSRQWEEYFARFAHFATARSGGSEISVSSVSWKGILLIPRPDDFPLFSFAFEASFDLPERAAGAHTVEADLTDKTFYAAFFQKKDGISVEAEDRRVRPDCVGILKHGRGVEVSYTLSDDAARDPSPSAATDAPPAPVQCAPEPAKSVRARFNEHLRAGMDRLGASVLSLSRRFQLGMFLAFMGFSLLYGMFHALGPGHGKALVAAFLMRGNGKPRHAVLLALVVAVTHTGMAVAIAALIKAAGSGVHGERFREAGQAWVGFASGVLVVLIGIYPSLSLFFRRLFPRGNAGAVPTPDSAEYEMTLARVGRWGVVTGLVPCPASLVILFLSIGAGVFWIGLLAVAALAAGLSAVLLVIGLGVVYSRRGVLSRFSGSGRIASVQNALAVAGGLAVVVLGLMLVSFYADRLMALAAR